MLMNGDHATDNGDEDKIMQIMMMLKMMDDDDEMLDALL